MLGPEGWHWTLKMRHVLVQLWHECFVREHYRPVKRIEIDVSNMPSKSHTLLLNVILRIALEALFFVFLNCSRNKKFDHRVAEVSRTFKPLGLRTSIRRSKNVLPYARLDSATRRLIAMTNATLVSMQSKFKVLHSLDWGVQQDKVSIQEADITYKQIFANSSSLATTPALTMADECHFRLALNFYTVYNIL